MIHLRRILLLALLLTVGPAIAASVEDGLAAFKRGNYVLAHEIWQERSAEGEARATYYLSLLYAQGKGVGRNHRLAMEYLAAAARAGHQVAQFNLGNHYNQGKWVEENPAEAARWWRLAAEADMVRAQHNLATLYLIGRGVPKDEERARYWYQRAAALGSKPSAQVLQEFIVGKPDPAVPGAAPVVAAPAPTFAALGPAWIKRQRPEHYTLQVFASDSEAAVDKLLKAHSFKRQLAVYAYQSRGKRWYALSYGRFDTAAAAKKAIKELAEPVRRGKPWPRRFGEIQKLIP